MRNLLISIAIAGYLLGTFVLGDLSSRCEQCPPTDVVHLVLTPFGFMVVEVEEGTYKEGKHSLEKFLIASGWITPEEYDEYIKGLEKAQEPKEQKETI